MRDCPECGDASLKRIVHLSKDYRCAKCMAEFSLSKGVGFLSALGGEFAFFVGIILGLLNQSWLVFILVSICIPLLFEYLLRQNAKLKLVGLRGKLRAKGL